MLVNELLKNYHLQIPFPWSLKKLKKAGLDPVPFLIAFGVELQKCTDTDDPCSKKVVSLLRDLEMLP